jgi:DNA polymerase-3 subunit gamma/tau
MGLAQKYRPGSLEEIVGNQQLVNTLTSLLKKKDPPHTYLFAGPTGCGKTTLGRICAKVLGCAVQDTEEQDSADFRGIDTVREIRRNSYYRPVAGERRAWILDEAHKLTNDAQNALLKGLEEPPEHCFYFLCTTDSEKLLPTIRSRSVQFAVKPLLDNEMMALLRRVTRLEGHPLPKSVMESIADAAHGHPRDALQILEKVLASEPGQYKETVESFLIGSKTIDLCRALLNRQGWKAISAILNDLKGEDTEQIRRAVLGYCSAVLLSGQNDRAAEILDAFVNPFYDSGGPGLVLASYTVTRTNQI